MTDDTYKVDPNRVGMEAGIYIRAENQDGRFGAVDVSTLEIHSLKLWLRSRGGDNPYAERVVAMLLGHDPDDITREWGL